MLTLDEFMEVGQKIVDVQSKTFKNPDDDWQMSVFFEVNESVVSVTLPPWMSNDDDVKEALGLALADYAHEKKPKMMGLVSSVWTVELEAGDDFNPDDPLGGLRPAEHPDRIEAVFVAVLDQEIQKSSRAKIIRTETDPPRLEPWETSTAHEQSTGRLLGPLVQAMR